MSKCTTESRADERSTFPFSGAWAVANRHQSGWLAAIARCSLWLSLSTSLCCFHSLVHSVDYNNCTIGVHVFYSCWTETTAKNGSSNVETSEWYTLFDVTMATTLYITGDWIHIRLVCGCCCYYLVFCVVFVRFATCTDIISIALNSLIARQFLIAPFALVNAGTPLSNHQISIVYAQRLAKI